MLRSMLVLILLCAVPAACWGDSLPPVGLGWVESSLINGSTSYSRGYNDAFVLYLMYYNPHFPQIYRAHSYAVFQLPTRDRSRLTDAYLCCNQNGVSGRLRIWVSAISAFPDSSMPAYILYNAIVNGPLLSVDRSPGVNGPNRRRLSEQGVQFLDSSRAQGWVVLTLVGADLNGSYDEEVVLDGVWLDLAWSSGAEEESGLCGVARAEISPNPTSARSVIHLSTPSSQAEVTIADATGRVVRRLAAGTSAITGLKPGVYVVRVGGSSPPILSKLVVTR